MYIDSYSFGNIMIDGKEYKHDILIINHKIISWWRKEGHLLQIEDLEEVWKYETKVLLIGQGASSVMQVSEEVFQKCKECNIKIITGSTSNIIKEFNRQKDKKNIVVGLHLTC